MKHLRITIVILLTSLLQNYTAHAGPADDNQITRLRISLATDVVHGQGYWSPGLRIGKDGGLGLRVGSMQAPMWAHAVPEHIQQTKPQLKLDSVSYIEVDKELCGERWCVGLGAAKLSGLTRMNGTEWNFGVHFRYAITENWSLVLDHYSHGSALGFAKDKSNRGWNLLGVAYSF